MGTVISVLKDSGDAKVTDLDLACGGHENVLSLQVSVENFSVMDVLDGKGHLYEPVKDLVLRVTHCMKNVRNSSTDLPFPIFF